MCGRRTASRNALRTATPGGRAWHSQQAILRQEPKPIKPADKYHSISLHPSLLVVSGAFGHSSRLVGSNPEHGTKLCE